MLAYSYFSHSIRDFLRTEQKIYIKLNHQLIMWLSLPIQIDYQLRKILTQTWLFSDLASEPKSISPTKKNGLYDNPDKSPVY